MRSLWEAIKHALGFDDGGPEDPTCQDNECGPF